jgi:hypothetical protein
MEDNVFGSGSSFKVHDLVMVAVVTVLQVFRSLRFKKAISVFSSE